MSNPALAADIARARAIIDHITSLVGEDDPDLAEMVDAECDLPERLRRMVRKARWLDAQAEALGAMMAAMDARKGRMEVTASGLRDAVKAAMSEAGLKRLDAPDFTASVAAGKPPLVVSPDVDPNALPDEFVRVKRDINKTAIREALDAGREVSGCHIGNAPLRLTVRTR